MENTYTNWKKLTEEQLLEKLKEEIVRLGLQDNPSRTMLEKSFDKNNIPHPNTYRHRFGSWKEIMTLIGLEYNGLKNVALHNKGQKYAMKWANKTKEELLAIVLNEMRTKGLHKRLDYEHGRDKKQTPSIVSVTNITGLTWKNIKHEYQLSYGEFE